TTPSLHGALPICPKRAGRGTLQGGASFREHLCLLPNLQAMDLEGLLKVRIVGGYIGRSLRLQVKGFKKAPVLDFLSVSRVVGDAIKGRVVDYPRSTLRQRSWRR